MPASKKTIRVYRVIKLDFAAALANFLQNQFPGETIRANEIDASVPIQVDPNDSSLIKVQLKEEDI